MVKEEFFATNQDRTKNKIKIKNLILFGIFNNICGLN